MIVLVVLFSLTLSAQRMKQEFARSNPDRDYDLKVDTTEMKIWTGNISYNYNHGYSEIYSVPLKKFIESFDENNDGKLSSLEFRRFQTGAKKVFSDATSFLTEKYDENKNRRLDKSEKEAVRTEVKDFLFFALSLHQAKKNGTDAKTVLEKSRALDDIYD